MISWFEAISRPSVLLSGVSNEGDGQKHDRILKSFSESTMNHDVNETRSQTPLQLMTTTNFVN